MATIETCPHCRERLPVERSVVRPLKEQLVEALHSGEWSLDAAAKRVSMSTRTLRRRLREQGTPFRRLLDEVRCNLAKQYLAEQHLSIGEIAVALGYSDAAPFGRAFRRWTGMTPHQAAMSPSAQTSTVDGLESSSRLRCATQATQEEHAPH